jgi:hypothetical protein
VPILANDSHHPGVFGFDEWLSVTNFFDRDPILSRQGRFDEFTGDSSEIVVAEALKFIERKAAAGRPSFSVIWFGTPHSPFRAAEEDMVEFAELNENSRNHYGELVAMDRAFWHATRPSTRTGHRRRYLGLVLQRQWWPAGTSSPKLWGGLRGFKGSLYEGGLRGAGDH